MIVDEMKRVRRADGTLLIEFNAPVAGFGWIFFWGLSRQRIRGNDRHYLWPQHVDSLFGDMEQVQVQGFWIPGISKLTRRSPRRDGIVRFACLRPSFGVIGDTVHIRARKPSP